MTWPTRYVDAAYVTAHFSQFGPLPAEWSAMTTAEKDAATLAGSIDLDLLYRGRMKGRKRQAGQVRAYPREGIVDPDGYVRDPDTTPEEVRVAAAELTMMRARGIQTTPAETDSPVRIKRERVTTGPVTEEYEYAGGGKGSDAERLHFPKIDAIMWPLLAASEGAGDRFRVSLL